MFVRPRCITDAGNSSFVAAISGIRYFVSRQTYTLLPLHIPRINAVRSIPKFSIANSLPQRIEFFPNETMLSFSLSFPLPKESNLWKRRRGRTMKRYLRRIEGERRNDDGLRGRGFDEATLKRTFMRRVEESAHRLTRSQEENRIKHI